MTFDLAIFRGVVRRRPEAGEGASYWAVIYQGAEQINERGPFKTKAEARDYVIDQIQRVKMKEGRACA